MPLSRLNYRHLYYFWMVAKEGHLTRVAEQMHLSQSALSMQIRQLEERRLGPQHARAVHHLDAPRQDHLPTDRSACAWALLPRCHVIFRRTSCVP